MLRNQQDWAALCLEYRHRLGLKQEAMADDLRVDQSTISRWERGQREPSRSIKQTILNELMNAGAAKPDQTMQFMLEQSGSVVAVWDRQGRLQGYSPRFERELRTVLDFDNLRNRHGTEILSGNDILDRALEILESNGFFEGAIALAIFTFPPFLQARRRKAGGLVTASTFPLRLSNGDTAMLCIYDHDVLAPSPEDPDMLTVTWLSTGDGHMETVQEKAEAPHPPLSLGS